MKVFLNGDFGDDTITRRLIGPGWLQFDGIRNGYCGTRNGQLGPQQPADPVFGAQQVTGPTTDGLDVLTICWNAAQVESLPLPSNGRILAVEAGNEPEIGTDSPKMTAAAYVRDVAVPVVVACNARNIPVFIGAISNPEPKKFKWLAEVVRLMPPGLIFGVSRHRYWKVDETVGYKNRAEEHAAWQAVVNGRPWAETETGVNLVPECKGWWFWRRCRTPTEADQATYIRAEIRLAKQEGCALLVVYQINSGGQDQHGIRDAVGTWRQSATVVAEMKTAGDLP